MAAWQRTSGAPCRAGAWVRPTAEPTCRFGSQALAAAEATTAPRPVVGEQGLRDAPPTEVPLAAAPWQDLGARVPLWLPGASALRSLPECRDSAPGRNRWKVEGS